MEKKKRKQERIWFVETNAKHVMDSIYAELRRSLMDEEFKRIEIDGEVHEKTLQINDKMVEWLLGNTYSRKYCKFFMLDEEDNNIAVSRQDAWAFVTGDHSSSAGVEKILEKSQNPAYAREVLKLAQSKVATAKGKGKSFVWLKKVVETYDKFELSLNDMKGLDKAIVDIVKKYFPTLIIQRNRKYFYFKIPL
jgi:hypothetical protein